MKTLVSFKQNIIEFILLILVTVAGITAQSQPSNEPVAANDSSSKIATFRVDSFTAGFNNNKGDLKWSTASEINISHFIIQKSTDSINYTDAAVIFAYGTGTDKTNYSFSDKLNNTQPGLVYYRLFSVDNSGKSQYIQTRIITVKLGK